MVPGDPGQCYPPCVEQAWTLPRTVLVIPGETIVGWADDRVWTSWVGGGIHPQNHRIVKVVKDV